MTKNLWWQKELEVNIHEDVFSSVRTIQNNQSILRRKLQRNLRLYGSMMNMSFGEANYVSIDDYSDRMNINVCASVCDTVFNKITKNKPRIQFLTEKGNFENQLIAKKLNKFVDGVFYESKLYEVMPQAFRDSEWAGSGYVKVIRDEKKIKVEKTFPGEIIVDELEGIYGHTNTIYQIKVIPKLVLMEMFPDHKAKIMNTETMSFASGLSKDSESLWVIEAWRLPTNKEKSNGRHAIVCQNATLLNEEYKKTYFPFVKLDWKKKLLGFTGDSLIDEIYPIQIEVTRVCRKIQQMLHLLGVPRVFLEYSSEIIKQHMTNEIGSIIYFQGQPPIISNPPVVGQELFQYLQWLIGQAFEQPGISVLSARSQKPAGLNSGKALREYNDIESERFYKITESYEQSFIQSAQIMIDYAQDIAKEYGNFEVMGKSNEDFELIKWSDINLENSSYVMQPFPTSFFSKTPSGQLADAADLLQLGILDPKSAAKIFDFPDVKAVTKYMTAPIDMIHKIMDKMVYDKEYISPEPFMDLQYGLKYCQTYYNESKMNDVPEDRLDLLRTWMSAAQTMMGQAAQEQQAKQAQAQIAAQQSMAPAMPEMPVG